MNAFQPWPKIPRLNREVLVTEKLDGTNAAVYINEGGTLGHVQSRSRIIDPANDNYGFAAYVQANKAAFEALGPGFHFGEWWGLGVQRGYGLAEKRFSLFNAGRWTKENVPAGLHVVPVLYSGPFVSEKIAEAVETLRASGSVAAQGFPQAEGVIVYHTAANQYFKVTLEKDEAHKGTYPGMHAANDNVGLEGAGR